MSPRPWQLIEKVPFPGSDTELCLYRKGEEFSIQLDGNGVMGSRIHHSEVVQRICDTGVVAAEGLLPDREGTLVQRPRSGVVARLTEQGREADQV